MYIGTQTQPRDDSDYEVWAQLGVKHITGSPPGPWSEWTVDDLSAYRDKVESYGIELDMVSLPLTPHSIDSPEAQAGTPNIMYGKSPERDRDLELICDIVRMAAEVNIRALRYNMNLVGILRTDDVRGRGGSRNSSFRWEDADKSAPMTSAGHVSEDDYWERLDYFLERVVPVATEHKVQLACHPHDPRTPPGYMGVDRILGTVEGMQKFVQLHESPFHGITLCQGSFSEMLEDPLTEIFDVIRWFGSRGKIFNVHFRNISGKALDFFETFPDEGSVDMHKAIQTYKEVDYKYMLQPDHVPTISGPNPSGVAFGYAFGYIRGLMDAIGEPGD
jgi:mannonate dehydratase